MHTTDQPSPKHTPAARVLLRSAQQRASRRTTAPGTSGPGPVQRYPQDAGTLLRRQRELGNRMVQRLITEHKTNFSSPNFSSPQATERLPSPAAVARKAAQDNAPGHAVGDDVEAEIQRARGAGQPLDSTARAQMEPALGADLGGVRVHADQRAHNLNQALDARAFTTGSDVFFRQGQYAPGSPEGRELLAHELTHVVQQGAANDRGVQTKLTVGAPDDEYEQEADQVARQVMRQEQKTVQRQPEEDPENEPEEEPEEVPASPAGATPGVMQKGAPEEDKEQLTHD